MAALETSQSSVLKCTHMGYDFLNEEADPWQDSGARCEPFSRASKEEQPVLAFDRDLQSV